MEIINKERRNFLQMLGIGTAAITPFATATIAKNILESNSFVEGNEPDAGASVNPVKSAANGVYAIAYGNIVGSKDFPLRPINVMAQDGSIIWFNWPSEKVVDPESGKSKGGAARGYIRPESDCGMQNKVETTYRIRIGMPYPPYQLYWRCGEYFLYKTPGSLIERAIWLFQNRYDNPPSLMQALYDMRYAITLNLIFSPANKATEIFENLCDFETHVREHSKNIDFKYYRSWLETILTKSKP